jgi:pimeloyl-ACP methyl ester carboxylesterase
MPSRPDSTRRAVLALAAALIAMPVAAIAAPREPVPIVFVHGNGDSAAEWMTTLWRFESNGYPRNRLFAVNLAYPNARTLDDQPEPGTSSSTQAEKYLADFVADVLEETGAKKVVFIGNSRGANTIRNFVKNGGGADVTAKVVLGGGVNHGVFISPLIRPTSEFNGWNPFMQQLNAGSEVVEGVDFLTLRSDKFDKYAQPDGRFVFGLPLPTGITYEAPALKGATNIVLPGVDHRETAMGTDAFPHIFEFITGDEPERVRVKKQDRARLDGVVTGLTAGLYDNLPVKGAELKIFEIDRRTAERIGDPVHRVVTEDNGRWGPFVADPDASYEFVLDVPGQPVTHIYRTPFLRGSRIMHLRPAEKIDNPAQDSIVILSRPTGYFGIQDELLFDDVRPHISTDPVPNESTATLLLPPDPVTHVAQFNDDTIAIRNWPPEHVAIAEFTD